MQLLIAIAILVGSILLAVFEFLILPCLVLIASSIVVSTVFEWFGATHEKTITGRDAIDSADDDSVYWDTVADAVSDGELPAATH